MALRDELITLAQRQVLPQARAYPFNLLDVQLAQQDDWRRDDLSALAQASTAHPWAWPCARSRCSIAPRHRPR